MRLTKDQLKLNLRPLLGEMRLETLTASAPIAGGLRAFVTRWAGIVQNADAHHVDLDEDSDKPNFIRGLFVEALGYVPSDMGGEYTLHIETKTKVKGRGNKGGASPESADASLGFFRRSPKAEEAHAVVEIKGTDTKDLDQSPGPGKKSPVVQALGYALSIPSARFIIVSNMDELRLYWYNTRKIQFWRFSFLEFSSLSSDEQNKELRSLAFLLDPKRILPQSKGDLPPLDAILRAHEDVPRKVVLNLHKRVEDVAQRMSVHLRRAGQSPEHAVLKAHRLVNRMLFIGSALTRDLVDSNLVIRVRTDRVLLDKPALWNNIQRLFRAMDTGFTGQDFKNQTPVRVPRFNGGLFRFEPGLDDLDLTKSLTEVLEEDLESLFDLAFVDDAYGSTLLGKCFERSLAPIVAKDVVGKKTTTPKSKKPNRQKDGIFYTPEYITQAICVTVLMPLVEECFSKADAALVSRGITLSDPLYPIHRYVARWNELAALRIIDPACGSGAFLAAALHYLKFVVMDGDQRLAATCYTLLPDGPLGALVGLGEEAGNAGATLRTRAFLLLLDRQPMEQALFGVDLHQEAVEYARLSVWLKSVEQHDILQDLGIEAQSVDRALLGNLESQIIVGDSLIEDANEAAQGFQWISAFPRTMVGGRPRFDAVIGNPPYVKTANFNYTDEQKGEIKKRFALTSTGQYDLYVNFIHLGLRLLRPGGQLGFIVPSLWITAKYGDGLRRLFHRTSTLRVILDFKTLPIFEEATNFTCIVIAERKGHRTLSYLDGSAATAEKFATKPFHAVVQNDGGGSPSSYLTNSCWEVPYSDLPVDGAWHFHDEDVFSVISTARKHARPFGCYTRKPFRGFSTDLNKFFFLDDDGPGKFKNSYDPKDPDERKKINKGLPLESDLIHDLIQPDTIIPYGTPRTECKVIFPYVALPGKEPRPVDLKDFPNLKAYAETHEKDLKDRKKIKNRAAWWAYGTPQNLGLVSKPKLVYYMTAKEFSVGIDFANLSIDPKSSGALIDQRCYGIPFGSRKEGFFWLGILNSAFSRWFLKQVAKPKAGDSIDIEKQFVLGIPIPRLSGDQARQVIRLAAKIHMAELHRQRLSGLPSPSAKNRAMLLQTIIGKRRAELDNLVHSALGLTPDMVSLIQAPAPIRPLAPSRPASEVVAAAPES